MTTPTETIAPAYMDAEDLAAYVGQCERSVWYWIADPVNPLPSVKRGRRTLIKLTDFEAWDARHRRVGSTTLAQIRTKFPRKRRKKVTA